jgi:hypothetical protein
MRAKKNDLSNYRVKSTHQAKEIALDLLKEFELSNVIDFGLPEIDDRYNIWRVPLITKQKQTIGEVVIDAITSFIVEQRSSSKDVLENRLLGRQTIMETSKDEPNFIQEKKLLKFPSYLF